MEEMVNETLANEPEIKDDNQSIETSEDQITIDPITSNESIQTENQIESKASSDISEPKVLFDNPVLNHYFDRYIKAITNKDIKDAAASLKNIIAIIIRKPDVEHMKALFNFFNEYKDSILVESVALQGIETIEPITRGKIEIIYTIMRIITKYPQRKDKINWDVAKQVIGNEDVVNWLISKSKTI